MSELTPVPFGTSCGWLSPEGKFYGCKYYEHDSLAYRLAKRFYGRYVHLDELGWLRIGETCNICNWTYSLTQPQIDAFGEIVTGELSDEHKRFARFALEYPTGVRGG